jgi:multiple sugar transport system permease protein
MIIVVPVVIGNTFTAALVAYGFSRFKFRHKKTLFIVLLGTMMLPGQVTLIPTYLMFRLFGWTNSILPLVVPAFFGGGAFNIFLIRQFMNGIPTELDEAAFIDGATRFRIFISIILPLVKPALTTVAVFTFMGVWNDFNGPLIYLNDPSKYTLALGLSFFRGMYETQWNLLMAATLLVMLPSVIIFFIAQKYIIDGISISSGTKG